ncbi:MAG TPA: 50S ribosomal protein L10 [Bacteroidia bacterium]|nr:50S ribosomal protein L10 [Bacteroidia bacterium]
MTREEKNQIIDRLADEFKSHNYFYITDIATLNADASSNLRRLCFKHNVRINVAKNTLIRKALEKVDASAYEGLFETLVGTSAIMFSETGNVPARVIKEFRKSSDRPVLKGAFIDTDIFVGDENLETLASLKSKNELIADVIFLLKSPATQVVSALQSGGNKLSGIIKTLEERGA